MKATAGLCYLIASYFARKNDLLKIESDIDYISDVDREEMDERKDSLSSSHEINKETSF